ncbi:MAG: HAMP domain-containing histidine kinase [Proteobacteria bacterium]|nr:HAMP domain-containing histidine kinase [Pseudomonadota bacterium]
MRRSIGTPLTIGIVLTILVLTLAVGWWVLVWRDTQLDPEVTLNWALIILGTVFFVLVMAGLVWLCVWLVLEMRTNQRQQAFVDAVTHELKTPLASFRLYLDTLRRHDPEPERRLDFLARMSEDLDRLDATVGQVLAAAKANEGRRAARGRVDLLGLLRACIDRVREQHALPEDAVQLRTPHSAEVRGDAAELELVFGNLLENAVKYSDAPVDVRVEVGTASDGKVQVAILDRGIGIPQRELRKIFQRFYRVGRDVQRTASGLGLGLFIVRNLVRRQGGRVEALSEGAGRGSRFVVTLNAVSV